MSLRIGQGARNGRREGDARSLLGVQPPPTRYEPAATTLRYRPPQRSLDPDRSKGWIRRVFPILRTHKWIFYLAVSGSLLGIAAQVLIPRYLGYAIDEALARPAALRAPLDRYIVILGILAAATFVGNQVSRYFLFRFAFVLEFDLRTLMYQRLARLSFPFFDRVQSGQLISRANADVRAVQMFLMFGPYVLLQFSLFFVALALMLRIHVLLSMLALVTLPFVYWVGIHGRKQLFPISWMVQARMAEVASVVDENINGVRVVKSFAAEESQISVLARVARRLQWAATQQVRVRARLGPVMENFPRLGEALILLYGGFLVIGGQVGPGEILAFMAYLVLMQVPFRMLGFLMMMALRARASAERIFEVLDEAPEIADREGALELDECLGDVEFRDVDFSFHSGPLVLRELNLHVPAGQSVAIVGRTGAGKSALAALIPRFYDVDRGAVLVDGHDVRSVTQSSLRAHVGMCFGEPFLFSASIRDNIAYARPGAKLDEVIHAATQAGAHEFIEKLEDGYDTVVGERGYTLSGGQRQRIAIARTILQDPSILILDDATSAIDVHIELQIHEAFRRLASGRTTVIIAHRLSTIALADRVVLLEGGRIVADGAHAELMATEPRYAEVLARMTQEDKAAKQQSGEAQPSGDSSEEGP